MEHFQVFVIQGTGLGRLESPEPCHEAKVQQATLPINKRFLWGFLMRLRNCIEIWVFFFFNLFHPVH